VRLRAGMETARYTTNMKLGVDFGTNRIVVAAADRGNYPLVCFEGPEGAAPDWFPSLVAVKGDERRYGWEAWESQTDESWTVVRSIKRLLEDAGPQTLLDLGEQQLKIIELLNGLASALLSALRERSNLHVQPGEPMEVVLGVPAHANSNQRFLTVEAFRAAGFDVLGVLNEPSAASIEFGHRQRQTKSRAETILVYDLGGGTFDASLVTLDENVHHVIASEGIPTIGGDDFDQVLADMALEAVDIEPDTRERIPAAAWFRLLEECRTKKEALNPNSRRIVLDLETVDPAWGSVQLPVVDFYEQARPLMEETLNVAEDLVKAHYEGDVDALYITGGGSELPLVARVLRERFGRRVRRSAYTRSATAIGLAIQADHPEAYRLSERLARYFGVWRESESGSRIVFDPLFAKGISLPSPGEPNLKIRRLYHPVHNIGHFRFLECSHRAPDGTPSGEVTLWDQIRFPFDPAIEEAGDLATLPVSRDAGAASQRIEELYECDSAGSISVSISNRSSGYSRTYRLGHWGVDEEPVKPSGKRRKPGHSAFAAKN
jgi:molecular chaperone DnaK